MEQEKLMEFAGVPMIVSSFLGDSIFALVPGSIASNTSRDKYRAYLEFWAKPKQEGGTPIPFIEWHRIHNMKKVPKPKSDDAEEQSDAKSLPHL